jgi:hypothetical protein
MTVPGAWEWDYNWHGPANVAADAVHLLKIQMAAELQVLKDSQKIMLEELKVIKEEMQQQMEQSIQAAADAKSQHSAIIVELKDLLDGLRDIRQMADIMVYRPYPGPPGQAAPLLQPMPAVPYPGPPAPLLQPMPAVPQQPMPAGPQAAVPQQPAAPPVQLPPATQQQPMPAGLMPWQVPQQMAAGPPVQLPPATQQPQPPPPPQIWQPQPMPAVQEPWYIVLRGPWGERWCSLCGSAWFGVCSFIVLRLLFFCFCNRKNCDWGGNHERSGPHERKVAESLRNPAYWQDQAARRMAGQW